MLYLRMNTLIYCQIVNTCVLIASACSIFRLQGVYRFSLNSKYCNTNDKIINGHTAVESIRFWKRTYES